MKSRYKFLFKNESSLIEDSFPETNTGPIIGRAFVFAMLTMLIMVLPVGCKKLVDVDPPVTAITGASVYTSDATAAAVLTGIYTQLSATSSYQGNTGFTTITLFAALSADEMTLFDLTNANYLSYYTNTLTATGAGSEFWPTIYSYIFTCNSTIEGLNSATTLTPAVKQQLLGEAKFMRAFFYFYLVNLYGDSPLALSTDYKVNSLLARSSKVLAYQQIIADLKDAQNLLNTNYVDGSVKKSTTERVRPTKWAATALLARTYLYLGDLTHDQTNYVNAEAQATAIINNSGTYSLVSDLNGVFLKNSSEAIWQLQPVSSSTSNNTQDALQFIIPSTGPGSVWPVYLSTSLVNSFEAGDQRKVNWIGDYTDITVTPNKNYYYPYKYKVNDPNAPATEYLMMLRLGEQFLIRAEARAQQGNISGAANDLNSIRTRAGLINTSAATQSTLITAIQHERQVELFAELGQRWFDLKRTNTVDAVMSIVTPQKGGTWSTNWQLYPILISDIQEDHNLVQNAGY